MNSYAVIKVIKEIKQLKLDMKEITDEVLKTGIPGQKKQQRISESRGAASLKTFTGDKKEFNEWLES